DLIDERDVILHLEGERAVRADRHTAGHAGRRNVNRLLRPPLDDELLRVDEQHFDPHAAVEAELEPLQRRQERNDLRLDVILAVVAEDALDPAAAQEDRILAGTDDQPASALDLLVPPLVENHILPKF